MSDLSEAIKGTGHYADEIDLAAITLLRGRVLVRRLDDTHPLLVLPSTNPRETKIHRGRVLAMGKPAQSKWGHEVEPGYAVGDEVYFVYAVALENVRAFGAGVTCVAQEEIQAVVVFE